MADLADNRLPSHGLDAAAVLALLDDLAGDDRDWRSGRVFSLVYNAGDDVLDLLARASARFSAENALNTMAFPSLGRMQRDIVSIAAGLLGADRRPDGTGAARGYLTSGGTESLLQTVKTARDWGRVERSITTPNMVLATSAHAAFEKASHYFDVESRRVPVLPGGSADVGAMAEAIDRDTVLVVGSAPSYPHGVIDPIPELGALADERGILCHVDACLGGFILPFLGTLGHVTKPWDLSVPGVTSISADLHKYGYASKGVSIILYGDADLARLQPFITSNWLGGLYGSPSMAGTRPGGPIAAGWAVLHYLGEDGYLRLAGEAWSAASTLRAAIDDIPGVAVRGTPDATVMAFGDDGSGAVDTFALGDELTRLGGWYFDRQTPPDSLHATIHAGHAAIIEELCVDLAGAAAALSVSGARAAGRDTTYGTV